MNELRLQFNVPFNSISIISGRWKSQHERLCAMKRFLGSERTSSPAGFEPVTPWSEVGRANRSPTRSLLHKGQTLELKVLDVIMCYFLGLSIQAGDYRLVQSI